MPAPQQPMSQRERIRQLSTTVDVLSYKNAELMDRVNATGEQNEKLGRIIAAIVKQNGGVLTVPKDNFEGLEQSRLDAANTEQEALVLTLVGPPPAPPASESPPPDGDGSAGAAAPAAETPAAQAEGVTA